MKYQLVLPDKHHETVIIGMQTFDDSFIKMYRSIDNSIPCPCDIANLKTKINFL